MALIASVSEYIHQSVGICCSVACCSLVSQLCVCVCACACVCACVCVCVCACVYRRVCGACIHTSMHQRFRAGHSCSPSMYTQPLLLFCSSSTHAIVYTVLLLYFVCCVCCSMQCLKGVGKNHRAGHNQIPME